MRFKGFPISEGAHDDLTELREALSMTFLRVPRRISLNSVIIILMNHAKNVTPNHDWLKKQVLSMPMRGRLPKGVIPRPFPIQGPMYGPQPRPEPTTPGPTQPKPEDPVAP